MGAGSFDAKTYRAFSDSVKHKSTEEIYSSAMNKNLDRRGC